MRGFVKGVIWYVIVMLIAMGLGVEVTIQVSVLLILSTVVDGFIESVDRAMRDDHD